MSKESYARGFCKAAAAAGVDPVALAKYAQYNMTGRDLRQMHPESAELDDPYLGKMRKYYKSLHPESAELDDPVRTPAEVASYRTTGQDLRQMHPESAELDDPRLRKVREYYKSLHPESAELDDPVRTPAGVVSNVVNGMPRPKGAMKPILGATAGALGKAVAGAGVPAPIRAFGSGLRTAWPALKR